jgi:hypothetical protein
MGSGCVKYGVEEGGEGVRRTAKRRGERRKRRECGQNSSQTASLYSPARHSAAAALSAGEHTQWPDPARARATKGASRHGVASREQWSRGCVTPIARARFVRAPPGRGQCTGRVYVPARGGDGLLQALALYSPLSYSSPPPLSTPDSFSSAKHDRLCVAALPYCRPSRDRPPARPAHVAPASVELGHLLLHDLGVHPVPQPVCQRARVARLRHRLCARLVRHL